MAALSPDDQANYLILKRSLSDIVEGNRFGEREMLYSSLGSFHQCYAGLGEGLPFRTFADYDNYLARLAQVPAQMANGVEISRQAAQARATSSRARRWPVSRKRSAG